MKISQRQAHVLRKRVKVLEDAERKRRISWAEEWPGGAQIATLSLTSEQTASVRTARKLGHAVVVTHDGTNSKLFALPLGVQP